ncbi:MAG: NfeD family protein [Enterobacter asburiae]|nr:NfeD family protein [Enterobacter asburiae]
MIELIVAHPHAFWLSLGGLLLAAEMLGGNGYLLWSGVAAVITGLLVWILPLDAHLNQRGQQIVGKRFTLDTALVNGRGHMRVGDSSWPVVADDDLSAGTRVEVIAVEGITLRVKAC